MDTADPALLGTRDEDKQHRVDAARQEVQGGTTPHGKALGTLAVLAVMYTLYFAASIVLPFVLAIVLFLLLSPVMRWLCNRLHLPRTLAALLMIILLVAVTAGLGAALSLPASGWIAKAPESLPMLEKKLGFLRQPIAFARHGLEQVSTMMSQSGASEAGADPSRQPAAPPAAPAAGGAATPAITNLGSIGGSILLGTKAALGQVFTVLLLLFFLLSSGDTMLRRLVEVLPTWADKKRAVQIAVEIERNVAGYLATITMMNALVGVAAGTAMWLLGLPDPLLWGTLAFLLNYIPIIGPVTGIFSASSWWACSARKPCCRPSHPPASISASTSSRARPSRRCCWPSG